MLLDLYVQQKLKQGIWTKEEWAALGDWGHGTEWSEIYKSAEMKRWGEGQGLSDLEVKWFPPFPSCVIGMLNTLLTQE